MKKLIGLLAVFAGFPGTAFPQIAFDDVATSAGLNYQGETYGASWGDVNDDALPDLFANNHQQHPSIYVNQGDGTFIDMGGSVAFWQQHPTMDTHGGSWADFDNDGDQDLVVPTGRGNPSQFFINEGGTLQYSSNGYNLGGTKPAGRLHVWFDYDGDGLLDNVLNSWANPSELLKGTGSGFTVKTADTHFDCIKGHFGILLDVTGDKVLDYVCPEDSSFPNRVWDVTTLPIFTDVTSRLPKVSSVSDAVVGDFNGDQRNDLFIVRGNMRKSQAIKSGAKSVEANLSPQRSFTFTTTGSIEVFMEAQFIEQAGDFSDIKIGAGGFHPASMPFTLDPADPDVAGTPTLGANPTPTILIGYDSATQTWTMDYRISGSSKTYFVVNSTANVTNVAAHGLGLYEQPTSPALILNSANGFTDATAGSGLTTPVSCVSAATGDFDNDIDLDLYLVCTGGASNIENILYENNGDGTFTPVADAGGAAGVTGPAIGSGAGTGENVAVADFDTDGFLDLFVTNGLNMRPKILGGPDQLFRNRGNSNHWVQLDLVGTTTNRDAVGARVYAEAGGKTQLRVQNGGYHRWSQHYKRIHFGLGSSQQVNLTVEWPSGLTEQYANVSADTFYRVTEGTGIAVIDIGGSTPPPSSCGEPSYDPAVTAGLILWQDCATGAWEVRGSGGGASATYSGSVVSDQAFGNVTPYSIESNDLVDSTTDPLRIDFFMKMFGQWQDGFSFTHPPAANVCFGQDMPAGAVALVGPSLQPVSVPFDLETQQACTTGLPVVSINSVTVNEAAVSADFTLSLSSASSEAVTVDVSTSDGSATAGSDYQPLTTSVTFPADTVQQTVSVALLQDSDPETVETFTVNLSNPVNASLAAASTGTGSIIDDDGGICGVPPYDSAVDTALIVYQDCGTGVWYVRATAAAGFQAYSGNVTSDQPMSGITDENLEPSDSFNVSTDMKRIDFSMRVSPPWWDGFNFQVPTDGNGCVTLDTPAGATILYGKNPQTVNSPFALTTGGPCL